MPDLVANFRRVLTHEENSCDGNIRASVRKWNNATFYVVNYMMSSYSKNIM